MRVFTLEDDPDRIRLMARTFVADDWTCIQTCARIDDYVGPYDLVMLDHDLGGRQGDRPDTAIDSGLTFARLIKPALEDAKGTFVLIHSFNPPGAKAIQAELGRGVLAPFGTDQYHRLIEAVRGIKG